MVFKLVDSGLFCFKFSGCVLDLLDSDSHHIDHVAENSSANHLDESDHHSLCEVVGTEVAISHSDHGGIGPVHRVYVHDVPGLVLYACLLKPVLFTIRTYVDHRVHDQPLH